MFQGWVLHVRHLKSSQGKEEDAFFFNKGPAPRAQPADVLPRAFKVGIDRLTGKPFLRPTRTLGNALLEAWYKKEAGGPLSLEDAVALAEAGVDPGVDIEAIRRAVLEQAEHLDLAGRFEEAAQLYEKAQAWESAGIARRKARTHYETRVVQNVQVNVNALLDRVREEGLVLRYKCPSCGSRIRISSQTSAPSLQRCDHCGSTLDTGATANYLRQILG